MSIIQWNLAGYKAKYSELRLLIKNYEPACLALQELNFGNDKHSIDYAPAGYNLFHTTVVGRLGAGLLIRNDIASTEITLNTNFQAVAQRVHLNKSYTICSIYIPPRTPYSRYDLANLTNQLQEPFLLLGDFNSRDPLWGDIVSTPCASTIKSFLNNYPVELMNQKSFTRYDSQYHTESAIDLSIVSPSCMTDFDWSVVESDTPKAYASDHYPIILRNNSQERENSNPRWCLHRADWSLFQLRTEITENEEQDLNDTDQIAKIITDNLLQAAAEAIPKTRNTTKHNVPWWNPEVANAIKNKKRASRRMQRNRTLHNYIIFKRYNAIAKKVCIQAKKESIAAYISSINTDTTMSEIWKKIKKFQGKYKRPNPPIINKNDQLANSVEESAEWIAQAFAEVSSGNFPLDQVNNKNKLEKIKPNFRETGIKSDYNEDFQMRELFSALENSNKSAAGPDNINYEMITHSHESLKKLILKLFNSIWNTHNIPKIWKEAIVIPILKPNKSASDSASYRPISLTSCLGKLLEKMVAVRLTSIAERNHMISNKQFGSRQACSTIQPVSIFHSEILKAFKNKKILSAVFFDLTKAYDTTWRHGLLLSLHDHGLRGNLPLFITNFLTDRYFRVKVGNYISQNYILKEGIPQGSVLSCTLFIIAINGIVNQLPLDIECLIYVDDLTIYTTAHRISQAIRQTQLAINRIVKWTSERGYTFSTTKTKHIIFSKRINKIENIVPLKLYNENIERVNNFRLLGINFDERLTWKNHIRNLVNSCNGPLALMNHLSHLDWGADRKTLQLLYTTLVQSKTDYGCSLYGTASKTTLKMIDVVRNKGLRLITGAFRSTPINSLHVETNILPPSLQRPSVAYKSYLQFQQRADIDATSLFHLQEDDTNSFRNSIAKIHNEVGRCNISKLSYNNPPWKVPEITACKYLAGSKNDTPALVLQNNFTSHQISDHSDSISVYSDASKTNDGASAAALIPSCNMSDTSALNKWFSIFSAECIAIILALKLISLRPATEKKYTIYTDSLSVIKTISKFNPKHPHVKEIQDWLRRCHSIYKKEVTFCWVPAHVGIPGNELVDRLAKISINDHISDYNIYYKDIYPVIRRSVRKEWQTFWSQQNQNKLFTIKPTLACWRTSMHRQRKLEVLLCRLRCGHTNLTHVHLMNKSNPPLCILCNEEQLTVNHIFATCRSTMDERRSRFPKSINLPAPERTQFILAEGEHFNSDEIFLFLKNLNLFNKI